MSIVVVGSVAYDSVKTPFGQVERALGGSATHFSASASFFAKLHLIGVVGEDFEMKDIAFLKERGVDCEGIKVEKGKTFHWKGQYGFDLNTAETLETHLNVFLNFSPEIPAHLQTTPVLFLGNIHPALQSKVLDQVKEPRLTVLDTMNFWIGSELESLKKVIARVKMVIINEGEARELTHDAALLTAARKIQSWGPEIVVIKRGEYGALLFFKEHVFSAPGLPLETVKDPTGAGDSFAGGVVGYLAMKNDFSLAVFKQSIIVGSTMASFNVEDFSCKRLQALTKKEISDRIRLFKELSHFEEVKI